jgi:hypothetical protein
MFHIYRSWETRVAVFRREVISSLRTLMQVRVRYFQDQSIGSFHCAAASLRYGFYTHLHVGARTNYLTPCSKVLEKLKYAHLVKCSPDMEIEGLLPCSQQSAIGRMNPVHTPSPISRRFIFILFSYLLLDFLSDVFRCGFPKFYTYFLFPDVLHALLISSSLIWSS